MKKWMALFMVAAMLFFFGACGNQIEPDNQVSKETSQKAEAARELLQLLYGNWEYNGEYAERHAFTKLDVNKDGTCVVDGKPGTWEIVELAENKETLYVDFFVDDQRTGGIMLYNVMGRYFVDDIDVLRGSGEYWINNSTEIADENDVALTTENWSEYFELITEETYSKNGFGEIAEAEINQYIAIKEEYVDKFFTTDAVFEVKIKQNLYPVKLSATEKTYTIEEVSKKTDTSSRIAYPQFSYEGNRCQFCVAENFLNVLANADPNSSHSKYLRKVDSIEDVEVIRVKGNIYFKNE